MGEAQDRPAGGPGGMVAGISGWVFAAVVTGVAAGLAAWGLRPADWLALAGCAVLARTGAVLLRARGPVVGMLEIAAGLGLWAAWIFHQAVPPLATGQFAGSGAVLLLANAGWRWWSGRGRAVQAEPVWESVRVLGLLLGALYVMWPLLGDRMVGGTDARWYAYMLSDFIDQWREAGPPVFIGQGEFVWNGGIHPFRSAPVYMHVAGLWDWLTGGTLAVMSLQHLTAITSAVGGTWGLYAAGVQLAPQRRWEAALLALLYVVSPAALMPLYMSDAYMTYMTFAAFAWVFYGNARILVDGEGWLPLAGGLSLAWMCHPPTAMQATLLTAFLQVGGLACGRGAWLDWRRAATAGTVFFLLSAYYFVGMSELPKSPDSQLGASLVQIVALLLGWFVAARVIVMRGAGWWALLLLPAAAGLWLTCRWWLGWLGLTCVLVAGFVFVVRRRGKGFDPSGHAPLVVLGGILSSAGLMDVILRSGAGPATYPGAGQFWQRTWTVNFFKPLTPLLQTYGDFQPGWGLWLAGVAAVVAACRRRSTAVQLVGGAVLLMSMLLLHWPRVGDFMLEYFPVPLIGMTGMTMELRTMPVFAALLAVGGLLALRAEAQAGPAGRRRWLVGAVLLLAVGWGAWQARFFVQRGKLATAPREVEAKDWRTENAPMDRFVYDLLPLPGHFSHGKTDPRLEVRLLDDRGGLIYGPPQIAEEMEAAGMQTFGLDTHAIPSSEQWLQLAPGFVLQPGERVLLRFQFDPKRRYNGVMVLASEHGYREYRLPVSGMPAAFGSGPEQGRVLSLWNSGTEPEHYQVQFLRDAGTDLEPGMHFAHVVRSSFRPDRAQMEVESLRPWRVRTRMSWSGQLESPRVFLPGYEAWVDGRRVGRARISESPNHLLQVAMPPGEHTLELRYVGTLKVWLAGGVSLGAWVALLAWFGVRWCRRGSADAT